MRLGLAIDGTVLTVPPQDAVDRRNHCHEGDTHVWRKRSEGDAQELDGADPFADQIPLARALPLWGGISEGGYADLTYHKTKKLSVGEWLAVVKSRTLLSAIKKCGHADRPVLSMFWLITRSFCTIETYARSSSSRTLRCGIFRLGRQTSIPSSVSGAG